MGTADSEEYMTEACPYETEQAKHDAATKRFNKRILLEPLIILCLIFGYCAIQAHAQHRDAKINDDMQKAEIAKLKAPQSLTCILKQNGMQFEYPNCTLLNKNYAQLN